jgi:hypothetical protein
VTWEPNEIPGYTTLTGDVDIFAVWKDKETEDEPIEDNDLVYKITTGGMEQGPMSDEQIANEIILLKLGSNGDDDYIAATAERDDSFITII